MKVKIIMIVMIRIRMVITMKLIVTVTHNDHKRINKFVMITIATVKIIVIPCIITITVIITRKITEKILDLRSIVAKTLTNRYNQQQ